MTTVSLSAGVGLLLFVVALFIAANGGGEVATLYTLDRAGGLHRTSLWVVETHDHQWVRANRANNRWLSRVIGNPAVELERRGRLAAYRAGVAPDWRQRINALMAGRYGFADWLLGLVWDRGETVPVMLVPLRE